MTTFSPEGRLIHTEQNKALCRSPAGLWEALRTGAILEARAFLCTQQHDLLVDFGFCQGIIPRQEGALGVADGSVRDIALLSRVGKPVCFVVQSIQQQPDGAGTLAAAFKILQIGCSLRCSIHNKLFKAVHYFQAKRDSEIFRRFRKHAHTLEAFFSGRLPLALRGNAVRPGSVQDPAQHVAAHKRDAAQQLLQICDSAFPDGFIGRRYIILRGQADAVGQIHFRGFRCIGNPLQLTLRHVCQRNIM